MKLFQISPRWNIRFLEKLGIRKRLPVIKKFRWTVESFKKRTLELRISSDYLEYFGVDLWEMKSQGDPEGVSYFSQVRYSTVMFRLWTYTLEIYSTA